MNNTFKAFLLKTFSVISINQQKMVTVVKTNVKKHTTDSGQV